MAPDRVLGQLNDTRNRIAPCTPTTNSGHKNMMHGLLAHRKRAWIEKREMATYMVDNVGSARKAWLSMEMQVSYNTLHLRVTPNSFAYRAFSRVGSDIS